MTRRLFYAPLAFFTGRFRGLFQYGFLHFGQTVGSLLMSCGTHSCSQRSQRNPQTVILTFAMRVS